MSVAAHLRAGAGLLRPGRVADEAGWWVAKYAVEAVAGPSEASALLESDGFNVDDEIVRETRTAARVPGHPDTVARQAVRFMFLHFLALMLEDDHANH
jgi:hypothetical protein